MIARAVLLLAPALFLLAPYSTLARGWRPSGGAKILGSLLVEQLEEAAASLAAARLYDLAVALLVSAAVAIAVFLPWALLAQRSLAVSRTVWLVEGVVGLAAALLTTFFMVVTLANMGGFSASRTPASPFLLAIGAGMAFFAVLAIGLGRGAGWALALWRWL